MVLVLELQQQAPCSGDLDSDWGLQVAKILEAAGLVRNLCNEPPH